MVTPSEELTTTIQTMTTLSEEIVTPRLLRQLGSGKGDALTFRPRPQGRDPNVTASWGLPWR